MSKEISFSNLETGSKIEWIKPIEVKEAWEISAIKEKTKVNALDINRMRYLNEVADFLRSHLDKERKNLRKNQIRSLEKLIDFIRSWWMEWLIKQPTWAGKTRLFWEILKWISKPSLVLVPRTVLVWDTAIEFIWDKSKDIDWFWFDSEHVSIIQPKSWNTATDEFKSILEKIEQDKVKNKTNNNQQVIICTYQSFISAKQNNPSLIKKFMDEMEIIISDEAHRSTWDKTTELLSEYSWEKIHLRLTATPELSQKQVQDVYNLDIIDWLTIKELVDDWTLIFPQYVNPWVASYNIEDDSWFNWNITNEVLDNLSESSKFKMEKDWKTVEEAVTDSYLEKKEKHWWYLPAVAFCANIKQAENYTQYLNSIWVRAVRSTSSNKEYDEWVSPEKAKEMLHNEEIDVVVTVSKVWEWWDVPTLRASLWLTPRQSPAGKIQWVWRTMRLLKEGSHHQKKSKDNTYLIEPTFKISRKDYDSLWEWEMRWWDWEWWEFDWDFEWWEKELFKTSSFFEMLVNSWEYSLEDLKDMISDEDFKKLEQSLSDDKLEIYLDSVEKIKELELTIWKKLEDIKNLQKEDLEFSFNIKWKNKIDSIRSLTQRIWYIVTNKNGKYLIWLQYLLLIKSWISLEEAKKNCKDEFDKKNMTTNFKLENYLDSPEKIKELEGVMWKNLDNNLILENENDEFIFIHNSLKKPDTLSSLTRRIGNKITWKESTQRSLWLKYLRLIKSWKSPEEADKICKKDYSNTILSQNIDIKTYFNSSYKIKEIEKCINKKLDTIGSVSKESDDFILNINWNYLKTSIRKLASAIWKKITWKNNKWDIWLKYFKLIKSWKSPEEAEEILNKVKDFSIEKYLISKNKIKELEDSIWINIDNMVSTYKEINQFVISIHWINTFDTLNKLTYRIWKKITWKPSKYNTWLDYLKLIKSWKTPKEAEEICKKEYEENKK